MPDDVVGVSSPSETASAAPDTSAIVREVMGADLSAESRPASEPSAPSQPSSVAAPTTPQAAPQTPAVAPVPAGTEKPKPPIPLDRHEAILHGERTKREAAEAKARDYEQAVIQPMQSDPVGWLVTSFAEVLQDPRYAHDPRLKSFAGKSLSGRASAPPAVTGAERPQIVPLVDGNGNKVFAAEDVQALLEWQQQQILGTVDEKLAPVAAIQAERENQAELAEATKQVRKIASTAKRIGDEYRRSPGWSKEIEPQVMARYDQWRTAGHDARSSMAFAYRDVVVPTLTAKERQSALGALQTKTQPQPITSRSVTAPAKAGPASTRSIAESVMREAGVL